MKKLNKKQLVIGGCILLAVVGIAVAATLLVGKFANKTKDAYTVTFELCTDLQTTKVLDRTVPAGSFLEEPEVYVTEKNEENWKIVGWYREAEYETQWDFDFDTVDSDLTLYAKWDTNPQCIVNFYTAESAEPVVITTVKKGLTVKPCDEEFVGREVLGYYSDKAMTTEFDFDTKIEGNTDIYVDISAYVYFNAKMISKWNICGNQSEVDDYEVSTSLSGDESILTVSSKNGGFLWLKTLNLNMNETSIIQIKMREVNDNYSGAIGGYILGSYSINGEPGASSDFGQPNTGRIRYARSAKADEDGFYTYTFNISNLTPGLIYDVMTGLRLDFAGTDKYTYEIKEIKTYVDEYAVSGEAFSAKGINFNGLHLNTFTLMGEAETEMLANGNLRFGGPNGAYIYKKGLNITLGEEQIIRLTAKGDLKGGAIALFFFGEYTQDGKKGVTTDFTAPQRVTFVVGETDANGYTTYTADISTIPGLKVNVLHGIRIDLYGEGTRTLDIQSLKSFAPTKEEQQIVADFKAAGLDLQGKHFTTFLTMGDAKGSLLDHGDYSFGGPNGVFLYKKNVEITLEDDQKIELKAKGDLKGGRIRLYLYGEYTQDDVKGTTTDYNVDHKWDFVAQGTDAKGYTTYSLNLDSIKGLQFNTIHGIRLDLYGEDTRTIEITSLKSVVPSKEETEVNDSFTGKGLDFTGTHLAKFNIAGNAETNLLDNGDYSFGGPNGAMIYCKSMEIILEDDQVIEMKAKGDIKGGAIALFFYGEYTKDDVADTMTDFVAEHRLNFIAGETDAEGYTTYTADISSLAGLHYDVLNGLRLDLYGANTRTIEIKSLKSIVPSQEDVEISDAFATDGLDLQGKHFTKFLQMNSAETELLANEDLKLSGVNGSFIHKKELEITLGVDQTIELKAKTDLKGGRIDIYMFGDYTQDGVEETTTDYGKHRWKLDSGVVDDEGYTTYTFDIGEIAGLEYQTIRGLRIDLIGSVDMSIEIQSLKSMLPTEEPVPSDVLVTYYVGNVSVYEATVQSGELVSQPTDDLVAMGYEVLGYYSDVEFETAFDFASAITENTNIYVKLSDYLYLSPEMLKQFTVVSGTAGNATATTEVVDGALEFEAVHGSYFYKKGLGIDVTDTQVLEFVASATVDVSRIDVWLLGTYMKDGVQQQVPDYNTNFRWLITPDTSGEYVTYKLDLGESAKTEGMTWLTVDSIRVDMNVHNVNNVGIIGIQSIKATEATNVLTDNFDGETAWTYTDANASGTVPAQGQEALVSKDVVANITFEGDDISSWGEHEYGATANSGSFELVTEESNKCIKYTSTEINDGFYYSQPTGSVKAGTTYTISFKCKGNGYFHVFTTGFKGVDALLKDNIQLTNTWQTKIYEVTATEGNTAVLTKIFFKLANPQNTTLNLYIDDLVISGPETTQTVEVVTELVSNGDFANTDISAWGEHEYGAVANSGSYSLNTDSDNHYIEYTSTEPNDGLYYQKATGTVKAGTTYTISFKYKGNAKFHIFTTGFIGTDKLLKDWVACTDGWQTASYEIVATEGNTSTVTKVFFKLAIAGTFYIDDLSIQCKEQVPVTTYTQGIGQCIESSVATETDNVLYIKDYTSVATTTEIKVGTTYKYTFMMRHDATGSDFNFDVQVGGTKVADVVSGVLDETAWEEVTGTFVASSDADSFGFLRSGDGDIYIDDIVLVKMGTGGDVGGGSEGGEDTGSDDDDQEPTQPEPTTGLVTNGNFEDASYDYTSAWRVQGSTGAMEVIADPADSENSVLKFTAIDANSGVDYHAAFARGFLEKDKTYTISFKYKGDAQFHIYTLGLISAGHSLLDDWVPMSVSDWTTYTCEITPTIDTTTTSMQFYLKMATAIGGTFYIDDFSIVEKAQ